MSTEVSFIQERKYQTHLLDILNQVQKESAGVPPPVLVELDCGMGKRVLSYLMVTKYFPDRKTLILLQASSSLQETADFFLNKYKVEVGVLSSQVSAKWRVKILEDHNVVLATPQTLANVLEKVPGQDFGFRLVLVNEVDKIIRRTSTRRTMVYPYPALLERFRDAWVVGLSGTLRDFHMVVTDTVRMRSELQTLADNLPGVRVISMEEIMAGDEEFSDHIIYTYLREYPVLDLEMQGVFGEIDRHIKHYRSKIIEQAQDEGLVEPGQKNLALIAGQLPVDAELSGKYNALLMMRKYLTGMLPVKWKRFLKRFPEFPAAMVDVLSDRSAKIQALPGLIRQEFESSAVKKVVVMVSYVYTGEIICKYLSKAGFDVYMISGIVQDKAAVINQFRESTKPQVALVMTQVGERDLDIPEAKLIVVYDTINTTKTMYQRFKRTRGGQVVCLCYEKTSEQQKVRRLLQKIKEKYPWSVKVPSLDSNSGRSGLKP